MSSTYTSPSVLTGLFKEVYGDDQVNLIPEYSKFQKLVPFVAKDKELGLRYRQNVIVSHEHGVSYAAVDGGAFALSDHLAMRTQDAQIQGSQMLLRSALSYDAASRASNGKKAFANATSLLIENMTESISKRLEISMLYGQSANGLAKGDFGLVTGTQVTMTIDADQWASGIFNGLEGARMTVKVSGGTAYGPFEIVSIDYDTREIVLDEATEAKGQDAGSGDTANLASETDATLHFFGSISLGASPANREMKGLDSIITTSGSLFNIDNSVYGLWKGNEATVSGQLTIGKILGEISKPISKGLDEDVVVMVNPDTWADLATDIAALRSFDQSYTSEIAENGVRALRYHSQNGSIDIVSHSCVKAGECFVIPPKRFKRIGAVDVTFKTPGREEEIFTQLSDRAGYELRCYTDQALFCEAPAKLLKISGFTNS